MTGKWKVFRGKSVEQVLNLMMKKHVWPIIETVQKNRSSLYIGPLTKVDGKEFKIYCYDAKGKWEGNYKLQYQNIFKIEINSKYGRHFNEYMWSMTKRKKNAKR